MRRSKQFIVVCGPSGCGKTMAIKHLVDSYGFIEPPFLTTRKLRPEEGEIGGIHVSKDEFIEKEMDKKILLPQNNRSYIYY